MKKTTIPSTGKLIIALLFMTVLSVACSKDIDDGDNHTLWKLTTVTDKGLTIRATKVDYQKGADLAGVYYEVRKIAATLDENMDIRIIIKAKDGTTYSEDAPIEYSKLESTGVYSELDYVGVSTDKEMDFNSLNFMVISDQ